MAYNYSSCFHAGEENLFKINGTTFTGGKTAEVGSQAGLIIACAPFAEAPVLTLPHGNPVYDVLRKYEPEREVLRIAWGDWQAPTLPPGFWWELLQVIKASGHKLVTACCTGGHGRTGTALAALLMLGRGMNASTAVALLRKQYCAEAVEATAQAQYLMRIEQWGIAHKRIKKAGPQPISAAAIIALAQKPAASGYGYDLTRTTPLGPGQQDADELDAPPAGEGWWRDQSGVFPDATGAAPEDYDTVDPERLASEILREGK